jgi:hypothetical protein
MSEMNRKAKLAPHEPAHRETSATMLDTHAQHCDFCRSGQVTRRDQHIAFRQWTDRGYVSCRVNVPLGVCDRCQSSHWNKEAEVIVEEAVRREYEKRPFAA